MNWRKCLSCIGTKDPSDVPNGDDADDPSDTRTLLRVTLQRECNLSFALERFNFVCFAFMNIEHFIQAVDVIREGAVSWLLA